MYSVLFLGMAIWFSQTQISASKSMYIEHDGAIISSLLEQGISKEVIANAISSKESSIAGVELLNDWGIIQNVMGSLLPNFSQFQYHFLSMMFGGCISLTAVLCFAIFFFLQMRKKLYQRAEKIIGSYINNDYSCHLPQDSEGDIYYLFAAVEQLATMLQTKNETDHNGHCHGSVRWRCSCSGECHTLLLPCGRSHWCIEIHGQNG